MTHHSPGRIEQPHLDAGGAAVQPDVHVVALARPSRRPASTPRRRRRESATIGQMIPTTNNANANTPTATTLCSPDAAPAAMPYAPSVNSTIDVSVSSPGPFTPTLSAVTGRGRLDRADDLADRQPAAAHVDAVREHDPVRERGRRDLLHVVGRHEVAAHDGRVRLRGAQQTRGSRAATRRARCPGWLRVASATSST